MIAASHRWTYRGQPQCLHIFATSRRCKDSIDFSAEPADPEQHSRATSIFSQIISHYEQSQTLKPYKRITLIRATHEYAISQETFLSYFFVGIHNQLVGDEESVSNSSFSQALAHFANFDSWDTERKDVLRTHLAAFAEYLVNYLFLPRKAHSVTCCMHKH